MGHPRAAFDECDYRELYARPHPEIVRTLVTNDDALVMYEARLPERLEGPA